MKIMDERDAAKDLLKQAICCIFIIDARDNIL
jgi:hypothetical protein